MGYLHINLFCNFFSKKQTNFVLLNSAYHQPASCLEKKEKGNQKDKIQDVILERRAEEGDEGSKGMRERESLRRMESKERHRKSPFQ